MSRFVCRRALTQLIKRSLESGCELFSRASAPVVKKDHEGTVARHVVMNGDDVETVSSESFEYRSDFTFKHRDVTRDGGVFLRPYKCGPCI